MINQTRELSCQVITLYVWDGGPTTITSAQAEPIVGTERDND